MCVTGGGGGGRGGVGRVGRGGFFFQAEDGIRDWSVTGVQTCAIPISPPRVGALSRAGSRCSAARGALRGGGGEVYRVAGLCAAAGQRPGTRPRVLGDAGFYRADRGRWPGGWRGGDAGAGEALRMSRVSPAAAMA